MGEGGFESGEGLSFEVEDEGEEEGCVYFCINICMYFFEIKNVRMNQWKERK